MPSFVKPGGSSSVDSEEGLLIQSNALSISRALSWGLCFDFFGSIWSSLANSPVGSSLGFLPPRIHVITVSRSFFLSSGVRRVMGIEPVFSNPGGRSSSLRVGPLLRTQSKAPSISRARSLGVCFFFRGSIWSILRNSPVGSSSALRPFRIQFITSFKSFVRSSGERRVTGTDPSFCIGMVVSSGASTVGERIQSNALSISRALSRGVCFFVRGSIWSILLN